MSADASLRLEIDASAVAEAIEMIDKLNGAAAAAQQAVTKSAGSNEAVNVVRQHSSGLKELEESYRHVASAVSRHEALLGGVNEETKVLLASMHLLPPQIAAVILTLGGLGAA